jgi:hypothetical protein
MKALYEIWYSYRAPHPDPRIDPKIWEKIDLFVRSLALVPDQRPDWTEWTSSGQIYFVRYVDGYMVTYSVSHDRHSIYVIAIISTSDPRAWRNRGSQ